MLQQYALFKNIQDTLCHFSYLIHHNLGKIQGIYRNLPKEFEFGIIVFHISTNKTLF